LLIDIKPYAKEESTMFKFKQFRLPVVIVISTPLIILGGCAGHETVKLTVSDDVSEYENDITESPEMIEKPELVNENNKATDDSLKSAEMIQVVEPVIDEVAGERMSDEKKIPRPPENIIGFDINKSTISPEYGELLWRHAQFLKQNSNFILRLSGHTDSTGNKESNQRLSQQRADNVAKILIDFGVPESRIKAIGNASDNPLVDAVNLKENRRVEIDYEDTQLVIN